MFQIFKELTERIQDKKEKPDKKKEAVTFDEFVELFQQCPMPEVEYSKHFEAFIQTLDVDDEGFKEDLKKCYAICSYRLDSALRPKAEAAPKPETKPVEPKTEVTDKTEEVPKEGKTEKMTGGSQIPACITSIRLKTLASRKREEVMEELLSEK